MEQLSGHDLRQQTRGLYLLIFVTLCVITTVCSIDHLYGGAPKSDIDVLLSGKNFAQYGFLKLHFLPVFQSSPLNQTPLYYLHYPPLGNIINGLLRSMGITSLFVFRFLAGLSSLIGVICLYKVFVKFIGISAALLGLLFYVTSRFFFEYSCTIHSHAYNVMYVGLFLYLFFKALEAKTNRTRYWMGCWATLFCSSLTSFEFILFLSSFAGIYIIVSGNFKKHYVALMLLATAPFGGVAVHFLQNVWAVGLDRALADSLGFHFWHGGLVPERFSSLAKLPYLMHSRVTEYFFFPWIAMLIIVGISPVLLSRLRLYNNLGNMLWACLIASGTWFLFMPSHSIIHEHTVNQMMLLLIITAGVTLSSLIYIIRNDQYHNNVRCFSSLILVFIIAFQSSLVGYNIYKQTYMYRTTKLMRDFGTMLPENSGILINKALNATIISYYSGLTIQPVRPGKKEIDLNKSIERLKKSTSQTLEKFYFVYANNDAYMKDDLFIKLATTYQGYQQDFIYPHDNIVRPVFLFDLLITIDTKTTFSDLKVKDQLKGSFSQWPLTQ